MPKNNRESRFVKLVEKIKNERIRGFLLLFHYHFKEILLVLLLLVIFVKKEDLQKIPYIGKYFKTEQGEKCK